MQASGCTPFVGYARDYNIPRIYDPDNRADDRSRSDALFADWQAMTGSSSVSEKDIEAVVYGFTVSDVRKIMSASKPSNSFAAWIKEHQRSDLTDYLVIAKECEKARALHSSRWYYPSRNDGLEMTLEEISETCAERARQESQLSSRYALQALRAMSSLGDYEGMETLWNDVGASVHEGVVRDMCLGHLTRAAFEHGHEALAVELYSKAGDISSVEFCLKRMGKNADRLDLLEYVARYCPDNDYAQKTLQEWFSRQVSDRSVWNSEKNGDRKIIGQGTADRICRICDSAVRNSECRNPAMWLYCKALALDLSDRPQDALAVNRQAACAAGTDFIQNSIHVLDIWLDARTATYDKAYERRLLRDLQWLDMMIAGNLTEEVRRKTTEEGQYLDWYLGEGWYLRSNQSYYYWNDMLKKILLGEVCPKLIDSGREVLAIRLANMADNRLLSIVDDSFRKEDFNAHDYSNGLFEMLNHEVRIESIEQYVASLGRPKDALESFLDARGYTDMAYFLDVAGTRYIRERQYAKAAYVLELVPSAYQYRLNTVEYMNRDPGQTARNEQSCIFPDYKLNFARDMAGYDRVISGSYGPDEKGRAKIRKGIGIRAAASFAWALTEYSDGTGSYWSQNDNYRKADAAAQSLIRQGLSQIKDKEVKGQELLNLQLRLEVVQNCKGTRACSDILRHCDEYADYR